MKEGNGRGGAGVTVTFSGTGGDLSVVAGSVIAPPGCPAPTITIQGSNTVVITFGASEVACKTISLVPIGYSDNSFLRGRRIALPICIQRCNRRPDLGAGRQ